MADHPELKKMQEEMDLASFGAMGFKILKGALSEGATLKEAIAVASSFFAGIGISSMEEDKEKDE